MNTVRVLDVDDDTKFNRFSIETPKTGKLCNNRNDHLKNIISAKSSNKKMSTQSGTEYYDTTEIDIKTRR